MSLLYQSYKFKNSYLDLTYITPRIIAASSNNEINEMGAFLINKHPSRYMIYDLTESNEIKEYFDERLVESIHTIDGYQGSLQQIEYFMNKIESYLNNNISNVVVFYCRNGLLNSGLYIACLLLHLGVYSKASEAINFFLKQRISGKIPDISYLIPPDFLRYIHYYECVLRCSDLETFTFQIDAIRFCTIPNFETSIATGGFTPCFSVQEVSFQKGKNYSKVIYDQSDLDLNLQSYSCENDNYAIIDLKDKHLIFSGDIIVTFFSKPFYMFKVCLNSTFISSNYLCFEKRFLDEPCQDFSSSTFAQNFKLELFIHKV